MLTYVGHHHDSASDRFQALAAEILPFAFVAKHDTEEQVAEEYSKCWTENTGGSGAVKLYLPEITSLAGGYLESARWNVKQTAALSIADICVVLGEYHPCPCITKLYLVPCPGCHMPRSTTDSCMNRSRPYQRANKARVPPCCQECCRKKLSLQIQGSGGFRCSLLLTQILG